MSDPTAGERARSIRAHPGAPQVVVDPTDPNYGMFPGGALGAIDERPYRFDPTNPAHGELTGSASQR
jgi:hypothetical protein